MHQLTKVSTTNKKKLKNNSKYQQRAMTKEIHIQSDEKSWATVIISLLIRSIRITL